jgi:hypothetical protein
MGRREKVKANTSHKSIKKHKIPFPTYKAYKFPFEALFKNLYYGR